MSKSARCVQLKPFPSKQPLNVRRWDLYHLKGLGELYKDPPWLFNFAFPIPLFTDHDHLQPPSAGRENRSPGVTPRNTQRATDRLAGRTEANVRRRCVGKSLPTFPRSSHGEPWNFLSAQSAPWSRTGIADVAPDKPLSRSSAPVALRNNEQIT